jgi:hypothetical protein
MNSPKNRVAPAVAALTLLVCSGSASASSTWEKLTLAQQEAIRSGQQIQVVGNDPFVWEITVIQRVAKASPAACAAIFWDLPGQPSYLARFGLLSINVKAGLHTAALASEVTAITPTPSGPTTIVYPWENALIRFGDGTDATYRISWHGTDASRPMAPGFPAAWGDLTLEQFADGGTLMIYHGTVSPIPLLLENTELKQTLVGQISAVAQAHAARFEQGPSLLQVLNLMSSLY